MSSDKHNDSTEKKEARAKSTIATRYEKRKKRQEELEALLLVAQLDADERTSTFEGECQEADRA